MFSGMSGFVWMLRSDGPIGFDWSSDFIPLSLFLATDMRG